MIAVNDIAAPLRYGFGSKAVASDADDEEEVVVAPDVAFVVVVASAVAVSVSRRELPSPLLSPAVDVESVFPPVDV